MLLLSSVFSCYIIPLCLPVSVHSVWQSLTTTEGSVEMITSLATVSLFSKVPTLWEGHKISKNLPPVLTKQLFLLSSVKTSGRFFQIFVAFSEKLDFTQSFVFLWRTVIYISWKIISLLNPVKKYHLERGSGPHFKSITGWGLRSEAKIGSGELDIMGLTPDLIGTWGIPEARRPIDRHISTKTNKGVKH